MARTTTPPPIPTAKAGAWNRLKGAIFGDAYHAGTQAIPIRNMAQDVASHPDVVKAIDAGKTAQKAAYVKSTVKGVERSNKKLVNAIAGEKFSFRVGRDGLGKALLDTGKKGAKVGAIAAAILAFAGTAAYVFRRNAHKNTEADTQMLAQMPPPVAMDPVAQQATLMGEQPVMGAHVARVEAGRAASPELGNAR